MQTETNIWELPISLKSLLITGEDETVLCQIACRSWVNNTISSDLTTWTVNCKSCAKRDSFFSFFNYNSHNAWKNKIASTERDISELELSKLTENIFMLHHYGSLLYHPKQGDNSSWTSGVTRSWRLKLSGNQ